MPGFRSQIRSMPGSTIGTSCWDASNIVKPFFASRLTHQTSSGHTPRTRDGSEFIGKLGHDRG